MANCQDLVNAVANVQVGVLGISVNLDAIREKLFCLEDLMRQALLTREFQAQAIEKHQQLLIDSTEVLARAINSLAVATGALDVPPAADQTLSRISASDLSSFPPCASTVYCPPGLVKDENGNCVEPPE